jgi:hypothetical protein
MKSDASSDEGLEEMIPESSGTSTEKIPSTGQSSSSGLKAVVDNDVSLIMLLCWFSSWVKQQFKEEI